MSHTRGRGRVYRQPGSSFFWIQYSIHGKLHRESSKSVRVSDAHKLLTKRLADANAGGPVGPVAERVTLNDLCGMIRDNYKINKLRSGKRLEQSLAHLLAYFGPERKAMTITKSAVDAYIIHRREQSHRQGPSTSDSTINKELAALKRAFALAIEDDKLMRAPKITMLKEGKAREGFLDHGEFLALREALPDYLKDPITFLYLSGWRVSEMKTLEWSDVNKDRTRINLPPEKSKNDEGRTLPVSGELAEVIERAHNLRRLDCRFVFHNDGKPIIDFRGSWAKACEAIGLSKLLVHDLRRSSVRNLVRSGISENIAMELSGHKTRSVFERYNITSKADLVEAVERRDQYLSTKSTERKVVPIKTG